MKIRAQSSILRNKDTPEKAPKATKVLPLLDVPSGLRKTWTGIGALSVVLVDMLNSGNKWGKGVRLKINTWQEIGYYNIRDHGVWYDGVAWFIKKRRTEIIWAATRL
jgi:hypothetical protein